MVRIAWSLKNFGDTSDRKKTKGIFLRIIMEKKKVEVKIDHLRRVFFFPDP
jgi:hypothetical protein